MTRKLIYVDNLSKGTVHEMYNASSLKMFSEIYDEVIYYTSRPVKKNTFRILKNKPINIKYKFLPIINWSKRVGDYLTAFISTLTICYVLFKSNKKDVIFYNFTPLWTFSVINVLTKLLNRKVILMFHGELEYLYESSPMNFFSMKALKRMKNEKFTPSEGVYFCVLSDVIKRNLKPHVSNKIHEKFISFEHSYIFRQDVKLNKVNDGIIRVGLIGALRKEKRFLESIMKFSKLLKFKKNIKLFSIGRVHYDKHVLNQEGINIISDSDIRSLTRTEMDNAISKLDYILFLYPKDGYKLRASGALYDAIDSEKPILALKNDYFNEVFTEHEDIGCLFENEKEIARFFNNTEQLNLNADYKMIKQKLSPTSIGLKFKKELEKIDFL
ncbi:MAG: hypothetical protein ACI8RP_001060 [Urechidicola sp.]|jgi:hypothetical protein